MQPTPPKSFMIKRWLNAIMEGDDDAVARYLPSIPRDFATLSGEPYLSVAVQFGHAGIARQLLAAGHDPNLPNSRGACALHLAVSTRHPDLALIEDLVRAGAAVNFDSQGTGAPLTYAVDLGTPAAVALLCRLGANAAAQDRGRGLSYNLVDLRQGDAHFAEMLDILLAAGLNPETALALEREKPAPLAPRWAWIERQWANAHLADRIAPAPKSPAPRL